MQVQIKETRRARRAAPNPCEGSSLDCKDATWVL
jgi:hypothetical protein